MNTPVRPSADLPSTLAEARATMSGLECFRRMMEGTLPAPPMVVRLGMRMIAVDKGRVVFTAAPDHTHYNGMGVVHGGYLATLLDSALGCAINSCMPAGKYFTTVELKINYTRPVTAATGLLQCEATVLHVGSRIATADARVVDARGKLYAHATTTCMAVEPPPREGS